MLVSVPTSDDFPSRHVDPARRLWLEPLCGCTPVELLEAAQEELRRDQAEAVRLAYVAATRARDLLIVPACGDKPLAGWLEDLNPALTHPSTENRIAALEKLSREMGLDSFGAGAPAGDSRSPGPWG
jgi:ATP-dependent exoDNAse (exonuclease V) beta subunit